MTGRKHLADRSEDDWKKRERVRDPEERAKLDKEAQKREDSQCQVDHCQNSAVHHEKEGNKSGRCLNHWEGESDDNG